MKTHEKKLSSQMGWSSPDRIVVRGHDLPNDLLGKIDLGRHGVS